MALPVVSRCPGFGLSAGSPTPRRLRDQRNPAPAGANPPAWTQPEIAIVSELPLQTRWSTGCWAQRLHQNVLLVSMDVAASHRHFHDQSVTSGCSDVNTTDSACVKSSS